MASIFAGLNDKLLSMSDLKAENNSAFIGGFGIPLA